MKIIPSKRILTAIILIAIILLILEKGGKFAFLLLVTAVQVLALTEFYSIFLKAGVKVQKYLGVLFGVFILYLFYQNKLPEVLLTLALSLVFASVARIFDRDDLKNSLLGIAVTVSGLIYTSVLSGYLILMRNLDNGLIYIYIFLIIIWGSDSVAYFIGSKFGKNKLSPAISPNKSIEGAAGGIFAGVLGGSFWWLRGEFSFLHCLIFGILISLAGIIGDLFESLIKRTAGIKDSGNFFPGHGGVLDRIDSLLFAAPVWYYYIKYFLIK